MEPITSNARKRRRRARGFSLLEVVAAIFILTVGGFGALQMFHVGAQKARTAQEKTIALRAIENELETIRSTPFAELAAAQAGPFLSRTPELDRLVNAQPAVRVIDRSENGTQIKEVTVSVAWTAEHGRRIEKSVSTLITRLGVGN